MTKRKVSPRRTRSKCPALPPARNAPTASSALATGLRSISTMTSSARKPALAARPSGSTPLDQWPARQLPEAHSELGTALKEADLKHCRPEQEHKRDDEVFCQAEHKRPGDPVEHTYR